MLPAALLSLLSFALLAHSQIITPASAVQCSPVLLTWTYTSSPPFIISVLPGGQVSAGAIENIGTFTSSSVTWLVDIPAGTSLTLMLRDGTGQPVYSAPFDVQSSSDASCLGTNSGYVGGAGLPSPSTLAAVSATNSGAGGTSASSSPATAAASASPTPTIPASAVAQGQLTKSYSAPSSSPTSSSSGGGTTSGTMTFDSLTFVAACFASVLGVFVFT